MSGSRKQTTKITNIQAMFEKLGVEEKPKGNENKDADILIRKGLVAEKKASLFEKFQNTKAVLLRDKNVIDNQDTEATFSKEKAQGEYNALRAGLVMQYQECYQSY